MPHISIQLMPGLNVEKTLSLNEAGYSVASLGRFKDGLFQKVGGWTKYFPNALPGHPYDLCAWQDLNTSQHLAAGQLHNLSVITAGAGIDIIPTTISTGGALPGATNFSTTIGSPIVTVTDAGMAAAQSYDAVFFNTPIVVGGLILFGLYQVTAYVGANQYSITASANATSTVTNGGSLPTFTSTNGSSTVQVNIAGHNANVGETVVFNSSTTVNGMTISGNYTVSGVINPNTFTIIAQNSATANGTVTMNAGNVALTYYLAIGPIPSAAGYGVGNYGAGLYGYGSVPPGTTGSAITAFDWKLSNWGEILVAAPWNLPIFYWGPNSGFLSAQPIGSGPAINTGAFVSTGTQILIAYGSTVKARIGVYKDPLLIQWCDQGNLLQWTPASTNQAGNFRIPTGSQIVGGLSTPNRDLIFTDIEAWSMIYSGQPFIFNINKVGVNCGLIGQHAVCAQGGVVYWMGNNSFFTLDGAGVHPMRCPVWDAVFQDLNVVAGSYCFAMSNTLFNEIWFFYPSLSGGAVFPDKYAKYNTVEQTWDTGPLSRMSGIDQNVLGQPIMAAPNGFIYQHETSLDGDGAAINPVMETGFFALMDGEEVAFIDRIIPDFKFGLYNGTANANLSITVTSCYYPGGPQTTYGPFSFTASTQQIACRIRGRLIKFRVESNDTGSFWRLGRVRFRYAPDGRR
jgi:hypothetical protein